jgi:hypothetical protein
MEETGSKALPPLVGVVLQFTAITPELRPAALPTLAKQLQ